MLRRLCIGPIVAFGAWASTDVAAADEPLYCDASAVMGHVPDASMCEGPVDEGASEDAFVGPPLPGQEPPASARLDEAARAIVADRIELSEVERTLARWATEPSLERDAGLCALEAALASPSSAVVAHARVARTRCLLMVDAADAAEELESLLRRYPELPDEVSLRLELGRSLARRGRHEQAAAELRAIDLAYPGTHDGALARDELAALAVAGHEAIPLSAREEVERAARLVRSGPPDLAPDELARLREVELPAMLEAEVYVLSARIARVEGRFDDADAFSARARELDPRLAATAPEVLARPRSELVARELRALGLGPLMDADATDRQRQRALRRLASARLFETVRSATRADMREITTALVGEATRRPQLPCATRFDIAVLASGTASDDALVALADRCTADAVFGVRARYLRARALERLGRVDEATAEYREVVAADRTDTRFYALWAEQRLAATTAEGPSEPTGPAADASAADAVEDAIDLEATLASLEESHGASYPWLARARALVALGDEAAAREELHELYLAWLDARGRGPIRAGVEAVYRGATRQRTIVSASLRRLRRNLAGDDAVALARVCEALGDVGLSIRFGGTRASERPRAFEDLVVGAAARHALDPNLLLAVMRVESVYDPEIVSYAGAIGLLQIMPRTGRLIAHQLGMREFRTDDLLDPATNIELAAWYLRSLIDRFDGRLPLAIAAYNGGPHNVRRWMEEHGSGMPLDAFLERIPFEQTFRYVRRVLSHYAAYRAQEQLVLPELDTTLPPRQADVVAF